MVISLTGSNDYLLKRRLDELVTEFMVNHGELAVEKIDAAEADGQTIIDAVQSLPFLADRKMVVVRSLSSNREASGQIEQIISSAGEDCDVVIYDPSPDRRSVYYKILQRKTRLENINELDGRGLANWLVSESKNRGGEISLADATYLVERVGANQVMLDSELNKLLVYGQKITRDNFNLLTEPTPQSKIFELLDAAFAGNKGRALKFYDEQRIQRVEPQAILAMVSWQLHLIVLAKLGESKPVSEISADTGQRPYPITKAAGLARKLTDSRLRKMVSDALEIDIKSKTSAIDMDEALKTYIVNL